MLKLYYNCNVLVGRAAFDVIHHLYLFLELRMICQECQESAKVLVLQMEEDTPVSSMNFLAERVRSATEQKDFRIAKIESRKVDEKYSFDLRMIRSSLNWLFCPAAGASSNN